MVFLKYLVKFSLLSAAGTVLILAALFLAGTINSGYFIEATACGIFVGLLILAALAGLVAIMTNTITLYSHPYIVISTGVALLLKLPALFWLVWLSLRWPTEVGYWAVGVLLIHLFLPTFLTIFALRDRGVV